MIRELTHKLEDKKEEIDMLKEQEMQQFSITVQQNKKMCEAQVQTDEIKPQIVEVQVPVQVEVRSIKPDLVHQFTQTVDE